MENSQNFVAFSEYMNFNFEAPFQNLNMQVLSNNANLKPILSCQLNVDSGKKIHALKFSIHTELIYARNFLFLFPLALVFARSEVVIKNSSNDNFVCSK